MEPACVLGAKENRQPLLQGLALPRAQGKGQHGTIVNPLNHAVPDPGYLKRIHRGLGCSNCGVSWPGQVWE